MVTAPIRHREDEGLEALSGGRQCVLARATGGGVFAGEHAIQLELSELPREHSGGDAIELSLDLRKAPRSAQQGRDDGRPSSLISPRPFAWACGAARSGDSEAGGAKRSSGLGLRDGLEVRTADTARGEGAREVL